MKLYTPLGIAKLPDNYADEYKNKTDIELLEELLRQDNTGDGFLDPILVSILIDKKLLFKGERVNDIQAKIQRLKEKNEIKQYKQNPKQFKAKLN